MNKWSEVTYLDVQGNLKFILDAPVTEEDITNLIPSLGLNTDLVDEGYREYEN